MYYIHFYINLRNSKIFLCDINTTLKGLSKVIEHAKLKNVGICHPCAEIYETSTSIAQRIHVPLSGEISFYNGKVETKLVPGKAYFLPASTLSAFKMTESEPYLHLFLDFVSPYAPSNNDVLEVNLENDKAMENTIQSLIQLITEYKAHKNHEVPGHIAPRRDRVLFEHIELILMVILSHATLYHGFQPLSNHKLYRAITFIESNYHLPIKNEDIAEAAETDTRSLGRLFYKHLQTSPHQYLLQYRIEMAGRELRNGKTVSETAIACGFQSENTFREAFKRLMGCPPSELTRLSD